MWSHKQGTASSEKSRVKCSRLSCSRCSSHLSRSRCPSLLAVLGLCTASLLCACGSPLSCHNGVHSALLHEALTFSICHGLISQALGDTNMGSWASLEVDCPFILSNDGMSINNSDPPAYAVESWKPNVPKPLQERAEQGNGTNQEPQRNG